MTESFAKMTAQFLPNGAKREKLREVLDWTVFSVGAASLVLAISATVFVQMQDIRSAALDVPAAVETSGDVL